MDGLQPNPGKSGGLLGNRRKSTPKPRMPLIVGVFQEQSDILNSRHSNTKFFLWRWMAAQGENVCDRGV